MSRRVRNDFINEESFGVEINPCAEVAASTVAMDNGFTYTQAVAGTLQAGDTLEGMSLARHTGGALELARLSSTNEIFQFMISQPIRFIADITFQLLVPQELNFFVGCCDNMIAGVTTITGGQYRITKS